MIEKLSINIFGMILCSLIITGGIGAQIAPRPKTVRGLGYDNRQKILRLKPNPRVKTRGRVRSRALVRMRGITDAEWVAFHAYYGNPLELQKLIRRKVDINSAYVPSCGLKGNALFTAVIRDYRIIVKMLIGARAKLDFTLHGGYTAPDWGWIARTPLQIAREMGNDEMVRILQNKTSLRGTVRRVYNPERFIGFVKHPTSLTPVKGGIYYDHHSKSYRNAKICRARYSSDSKYVQHGKVLRDASTGRMVCDSRYYQTNKPDVRSNFEVLVHKAPLRSNQEVIWQSMYSKYSYGPALKLDGKLFLRSPIHHGFTLSGIDHLWYRYYTAKSKVEARKDNMLHEILTIVEHD